MGVSGLWNGTNRATDASVKKKAIDRTRSFASHARTLRSLQRDIDAKSKSYLELLKRHEDAVVTRSLTLQGEASKVWVIERPTRPSGKKPFPWFVLAIGGLIGGLVIGLGVSLGLEVFDPTARTSSQAADATSAPLLATLPALEDEP